MLRGEANILVLTLASVIISGLNLILVVKVHMLTSAEARILRLRTMLLDQVCYYVTRPKYFSLDLGHVYSGSGQSP